jgi:hypothetical protein
LDSQSSDELIGFVDPINNNTLSIWWSALIWPHESVYERLLGTSKVTIQRALIWIGVSFLIAYLVSLPFVFKPFPTFLSYGLVFIGFGLILLLIFSSWTHFIALLMRGTGKFTQIVYLYAAIISPIVIINSILSSFIPGVILAILISIYGIGLSVVAAKAVYKFSWEKSIIASLILLVFLLICGLQNYVMYIDRMGSGF